MKKSFCGFILLFLYILLALPMIANSASISTHPSNFLTLLERCDTNGIKRAIMKGAMLNEIYSTEVLPWLFTVQCSNSQVITEITKAGVEINAKIKGTITPSMITKDSPYFYILTRLLEVGANTEGVTPLMITVASQAKLPVLVELIKAGADVNAKNSEETTPLMVAAKYANDSLIVAELIKSGADVNATNKYGITPLMEAAENNREPLIIAELIKSGANVNSIDKNGLTALMIAAGLNSESSVVKELIKSGADINAKDKEGLSSLDYAKTQNWGSRNSTIDLLVKAGAK